MHFGPPSEIFGVDGIIILVVVVLVLFGSTQIPKLARSLGSAQKEFKKGLDEGSADDGKSTASVAQAAPPAAVSPPPAASAAPPAAPTPPATPATAPPAVQVNVEGQPGAAS